MPKPTSIYGVIISRWMSSMKRSGIKVYGALDIQGRRGDATRPTYPWDRQVNMGETVARFNAFCSFRDAGPDRTITSMVKLGVVPGKAFEWSRSHKWVERAEMYDDWMERETRKRNEKDRIDRLARQARIGRKMQEKAEVALDTGLIQPESVRDVVMLAKEGQAIERLATGESTENSAGVMKFVYGAELPPWAPAHLLNKGDGDSPDAPTRGEKKVDIEVANVASIAK